MTSIISSSQYKYPKIFYFSYALLKTYSSVTEAILSANKVYCPIWSLNQLSFMQIKKNKCPSIESWGTPFVIDFVAAISQICDYEGFAQIAESSIDIFLVIQLEGYFPFKYCENLSATHFFRILRHSTKQWYCSINDSVIFLY